MSLLAKVKSVKFAKPGKTTKLKSVSSASSAISSILKGSNKVFSTAQKKSASASKSAGKSAVALIKKLKKNKGV